MKWKIIRIERLDIFTEVRLLFVIFVALDLITLKGSHVKNKKLKVENMNILRKNVETPKSLILFFGDKQPREGILNF